MTNKTLRAALPAVATAMLASSPALADLVYENKSGGSVQLYGQFSPAFAHVDDGVESNTNFADSGTSGSRIGVRVTQPLGENTFRFRFETALGLPSTAGFDNFGNSGNDGYRRTDIRHFDFSLGGDWGRVSFGQGSMAADGASETVLGAVGANFYQFTGDANASVQFRTEAGALSGVELGDVFDTFDGSRRVRLRYDTPDYNGLSGAVAVGQNRLAFSNQDDTYYDIAVNYAKDYGGFEVAASAGYQVRDRDAGGETDSFVASAGLKFDNGIGFAVGAGTQDDDRTGATDPSWYYAQVSYDAEWISLGTTSFGLDYYNGSDFNSNGSESESWGIGVFQEVEAYNATLYATYRDHSFDETGENFLDISSLLVGARWRF